MSGQTPLPSTPIDLPLLPLRDVVVFPHMVIPLFVGRPKSIKALEAAMDNERRIMLVAQKAAAKDEPSADDMFEVGCVATILQMLKLPDGTVKVLVEGLQRAKVLHISEGETHFSSSVNPIDPSTEHSPEQATELEALRRAVMQQFDQYVKLNKKIPAEILTSISSIDDAGRLADTIAAHLPLKLESKQVVLDLDQVNRRLENLFEQIEREVDILNVDKRIRGRVKRQMEKNQRDFYLALDAATDALVNVEDVDLAFDLLEQVFQAAVDLIEVEHHLFGLELQRQVRGDGVGQTAGIVDAGNRGEDLGRDFFVQFDVLVELLHDRAAQGFELGGLLGAVLGAGVNRVDRTAEVRLAFADVQDLGALQTFDQDLHGAVGQFEHLQNGGHTADLEHVVGRGLVFGGGFLRDQHDAALVVHGRFERLDALGASHEQGNDHVREHHHIAQRQEGQVDRGAGQWGLTGHVKPLRLVWPLRGTPTGGVCCLRWWRLRRPLSRRLSNQASRTWCRSRRFQGWSANRVHRSCAPRPCGQWL